MKVLFQGQDYKLEPRRFGEEGWRLETGGLPAGLLALALRKYSGVHNAVATEQHVLVVGEYPEELTLTEESSLGKLHRLKISLNGPDQVPGVEALLERELPVLFLGFQPGFAYLGNLPAHLKIPRRDSPRPNVPAKSLGIGGGYAGIYPGSSPGGWWLVGKVEDELELFTEEQGALLAPGDRVVFYR
jgi:hypothetical protein